jgi:hypothetical protein
MRRHNAQTMAVNGHQVDDCSRRELPSGVIAHHQRLATKFFNT